MWFHALD